MCRGWALILAQILTICSSAQSWAQTAKPPNAGAVQHSSPAAELDSGAVSGGVYRNKALGLSCKIPDGWVLRTDEMNAREEETSTAASSKTTEVVPFPGAASKVLLAAFSRPPEARGEDVNNSIVIAAESITAYPSLSEAAQYLGPITEVAQAQGFTAEGDPYEIAIENKTLVRGDFHKDVSTRVMHQSTLVFLSQGYAVSITFIGGTDDEVEDLVDRLDFRSPARAQGKK